MSRRYRVLMLGDVDIASVASLLADPARARILMALGDGRALPASVLASEAGVAPSTASAHLSKLLDGNLLMVEQHGRHRYYRIASEAVAELIEALAALAPTAEIRSLKEGTASRQLRHARTCYDHLAGRVGVTLMSALLSEGILEGGDGLFFDGDKLSSPGHAVDYRLTPTGHERLERFGIDFTAMPRRRPMVRYCVDWSEQRHHLSGGLGAAILTRMQYLDWVRRAPHSRAVQVTDAGYAGLAEVFGVGLDRSSERAAA